MTRKISLLNRIPLESHPMNESQTEAVRALQTALDRRDNGGAAAK
jgi:hypothetical protein